MSFETIHPADVIENDEGDVTSGADYMSNEHELVEPSDIEANVREYAARVAADMIARAETTPVEMESAATRAYNEADRKVDDLVDKSVYNVNDAWNHVDPSGKIRREYQDERDREQAAFNHERNAEIRDEARERTLAGLKEQYKYEPEKLERAISEQRARWRAEDEKRGRRS